MATSPNCGVGYSTAQAGRLPQMDAADHRDSFDHDHVLADLVDRYEAALGI